MPGMSTVVPSPLNKSLVPLDDLVGLLVVFMLRRVERPLFIVLLLKYRLFLAKFESASLFLASFLTFFILKVGLSSRNFC